MGKKKKGLRNLEAEELDSKSFSTASIGGSSVRGTLDRDFEVDELPEDPFELQVEKLYEKRAATRVDALQKLISLFLQDWQFEECAFRQETFARLFMTSIRKGGPQEVTLAAHALGLHVVTLGASEASESIFKDVRPVLESLISKGKNTACKVALVDALAMLCFVSAEDGHDTLHIVHVLLNALGKESSAIVLEIILRSFTLLLTTVPTWQLNASYVEAWLSLLTALLHSESIDVRSAAGEAIAFLYHTCNLTDLPASEITNASFFEDNGAFGRGASPPTNDSHDGEHGIHPGALDDIVDRMKNLATNRGDANRRSKKERASQKGTFRELMNVVEEGLVASQKIKLGTDTVVLERYTDIIRVNAFRRYLGSGFQVHMLLNPLLHDIFNFTPSNEPVERLSAKEKRLYRSQTSAESKDRSQIRKRERQAMNAYRTGHMGHSYDE